MTDPVESERPVPRWLHAWAVLTVAVTLILLILGQFVTSFRAGMADPVWPTEPWYLFVVGWKEPDRGYLIEHSHRIAGWAVGIVTVVLATGCWWTEPRKSARWAGLAALLVLLGAYGEFHGAMIAQRNPSLPIQVPMRPVILMGAALVVIAAIGVWGWLKGVRSSGVRVLAIAALVSVMVQGLLGGFRVRLNDLVGPELAPIHGVFAQVVFCLLVTLAVLTARPVTAEVPSPLRKTLVHLSRVLVVLLFVQLVWGALVRHMPSSLNQRLHLLTAFLAVATAVFLLRTSFATPAVRSRLAKTGWILGCLLALQVTLGVEAWMGKFGEEARQGKATFLAEAEKVSQKQAAIRTSHALVGTGVLATAVALALRISMLVGRRPGSGGASWTEDRVPAHTAVLTTVGSHPGDTP